MPEADSENPPKEMTKLGVACRCQEAGHIPADEELVKQADGSMVCPHCGQSYLFRVGGNKKPGEECSDARG